MEFTKTFNEMISMVENVFKITNTKIAPIYRGSPAWDGFKEECENNNIKIAFGLTKFVIYFDDFVVKIPFRGDYHCWVEKEDDRYYDYTTNHCRLEVEDYESYCSTEIGFLLVPTVCIGKLNDLSIYAQPKCEPYSYDKHSPSEQDFEMVGDLDYFECTTDDDEAVAVFIKEFGDDASRILNLLDDFDIRDIHFGNIGYLNGKLVIFDFCGYHE